MTKRAESSPNAANNCGHDSTIDKPKHPTFICCLETSWWADHYHNAGTVIWWCGSASHQCGNDNCLFKTPVSKPFCFLNLSLFTSSQGFPICCLTIPDWCHPISLWSALVSRLSSQAVVYLRLYFSASSFLRRLTFLFNVCHCLTWQGTHQHHYLCLFLFFKKNGETERTARIAATRWYT